MGITVVKHGSKWKPDIYARLNSWGHRWEPRTKTITSFIFICMVASMDSLILVTVAFIITILAVISVRLPLWFLGSRLVIAMPFVIFMALTVILGGGLPPLYV